MAIEKFTLNSAQDVANVLTGLGWFTEVRVEDTTVHGIIDNVPYVGINVGITGGTSASGTPGVYFYTKGSSAGSITVAQAHNNALHRFAIRTKNGVIFASHSSVGISQSYYFAWMLAKTTNEKLAAVIPGTNNFGTYGERYFTAAADETSQNANTGTILLAKPGTSLGCWDDSPQIVGYPIPTHPLSGTSYIKNGMGFALCPNVSIGKMTINGTDYATNGVFALSDED